MSTTTRTPDGRFATATGEQDTGAEPTALEQAKAQVEQITASIAACEQALRDDEGSVSRVTTDIASGRLDADFLERDQAQARIGANTERRAYLAGLLAVAEQVEASYGLEDDALGLIDQREDVAAAHHEAVAKVRAALAEYIAAVSEWNTNVGQVARDASAADLEAETTDPSLPVRISGRSAVLVAGRKYEAFSTTTDGIIREARAWA